MFSRFLSPRVEDRPAPAEATSAPAVGRLLLSNIDKRFTHGEMSALQGVSLDCQSGEFVVVVGPSGCGKTTLLNIAAGMVRPDRGKVTLDGRPVWGPGPERAMVFQDHGLFPWLTAAQNVEFGLKMARVPADERADRVEAALRMVHLLKSGEKLVHELSGGMRQRIAIARALVMDPAVLLMDEPFAALDAQTRTLLHVQLQELWLKTHKTILFVTHSVGEAVRLADRIIVLHSHPGRVRKEIRVDLPHPRKSTARTSTRWRNWSVRKSKKRSIVLIPWATMRGSLRNLVIWVILLTTWEAAYRHFQWRPYIFPAPSQVLDSMLNMLGFTTGFGDPLHPGWPIPADATPPTDSAFSRLVHSPLISANIVSAVRLIVGFALAILLGTMLGLCMWRWLWIDEFCGPMFLGFQTLPSVCWVPLAVLIFGLNEQGILFVLLAGSTFGIAISMRDGLRTIPPLYQRADECWARRDGVCIAT